MKKIFALAVLFAAISLVACGGEQKKAADAQEEAATECCAECEKAAECPNAAAPAEAAPAEVAPAEAAQ